MADGPGEEDLKKKKALDLMGDYLHERDALHEGPRFHVPPFVEKRIEGTRTIFYAPTGTGPAEPPRPVSFKRPFVKPDTFGLKKGLPPLPARPSAKDLIARLRVVREGVGAEEAPPAPEAPAEEPAAPAAGGEAKKPEAAPAAPAPPEAPEEPPAPAPGPALQKKSEGGKLCPSCGTRVDDGNALLICTDCGRKDCQTCGRYELSHMKTDIFYEYQFDFPLCLTCYEKAFSIQRALGRAGTCYGSGNYSYALYYANSALQQDPHSKYAPKATDMIDKINKAREDATKRDTEWRFTRKHFASRPRAEDPRWK